MPERAEPDQQPSKADTDDANARQPAPNLSTDHQDEGDAARPSDILDRDQPASEDDGGRRSSLT